MTLEEYMKLFHDLQLNLVAFNPLLQCNEEVLKLVNAAIAAEREACAKVCETLWDTPNNGMATEYEAYGEKCAAAIRTRGHSEVS